MVDGPKVKDAKRFQIGVEGRCRIRYGCGEWGTQGNAIQCQFSGSAQGQLCCDPRAPLRYSQKLLCQRVPANWVMLLENKTDTPSTSRRHARQEPGPSQLCLATRDMVSAEGPGLSALGALVQRVYDEKYRVLDCFFLPEKEPSSHRKHYGDDVCQPRVLYSRLQRYPNPYAAIGPRCQEVPLGVTQAAVCCLKAATTGLEAWLCLLDHEKCCSKRLMPTLQCQPVVIVQVMDAIPKAGESHQIDSVSLMTAHPVVQQETCAVTVQGSWVGLKFWRGAM